MAERRMFAKKITDDDHFMELSSSAQALYLHLSMSADDDGFSNQLTISMFRAHASAEDLRQLLEKRYIYQFENGVIVIKHWRMANTLRKDRYTPTAFQEELAQLQIKDNGAYTRLPDGCQVVANRLPQVSIGQDRSGQDSVKRERRSHVFAPPTLEDIEQYCAESGIHIEADAFLDYYEQSGWRLKNGNQMTNWKSAVRNWHRRQQEYEQKQQKEAKTTKFNDFKQRNYNYTELEQRLLGMEPLMEESNERNN